MLSMNKAMANVQGCSATNFPSELSMRAALWFMKVLLIQTTPNTAIVAEAAEENKLALVTAAAFVLQKRIIQPAAASMMIMIMDGIWICPALFTANPGLNPS